MSLYWQTFNSGTPMSSIDKTEDSIGSKESSRELVWQPIESILELILLDTSFSYSILLVIDFNALVYCMLGHSFNAIQSSDCIS